MAPTITRKVYELALAKEGQEGTTVDRKDGNVRIVSELEGSSLILHAKVEGEWVEKVSAELVFEEENVRAAVSDVLEIVGAFDASGRTRGLLSSLSSLRPSALSVREDGLRDVNFYFEFKDAGGKGTDIPGHSSSKPELYPAVEVIFEEFLRA